MTTNTTQQQPQYPHLVAKDPGASFFLDRQKSGRGHLELLIRKIGGEEQRLTLTPGRKDELVDFIDTTVNRQADGRSNTGLEMKLDRYLYQLKWPNGEVSISRESAARIANELRNYA